MMGENLSGERERVDVLSLSIAMTKERRRGDRLAHPYLALREYLTLTLLHFGYNIDKPLLQRTSGLG